MRLGGHQNFRLTGDGSQGRKRLFRTRFQICPWKEAQGRGTRPHTLNKKTLVSAGDKDWVRLSGTETHPAEISPKNGLDKVWQNGHIDAKQTPD